MSVNIVDCTVPEKILLAAHQLEEQGQSPFSAEALIVAAWQKFPKTFGLKGYTDQYPDSNKVLSSIMGERGLTRRGWMVKMGQKLYSLTKEGHLIVKRIQSGEEAPPPPPRTARLSRDQEKVLLGLFNSTAVQKYEESRKEELTFADACRFWGLTDNVGGDAVDTRLDRMRAQLNEMVRGVGSASVDLHNGRVVSREDIEQLHEVREYLEERFARHLSLLRNRVVRS